MKAPLFAVSVAALALTACATPQQPTDGVARAKLGERVYVDGPLLTPVRVLEDSRCPKDVQCVWAGQLRLSVRVHLGSRDEMHELTLGTPLPVADGSLELVEAIPQPVAGDPIKPASYRFGFRFMGGI
jgi:hypothetical protein